MRSSLFPFVLIQLQHCDKPSASTVLISVLCSADIGSLRSLCSTVCVVLRGSLFVHTVVVIATYDGNK